MAPSDSVRAGMTRVDEVPSVNKKVNDSLCDAPFLCLALGHQTMEQICFVL